MNRRRNIGQDAEEVIEANIEQAPIPVDVPYDIRLDREFRRKEMEFSFRFDEDSDQNIDLKIGSIFVIGLTDGVYSSSFKYRFAAIPSAYRNDIFVDNDDGFDAKLELPDVLSGLVEYSFVDRLIEYHGAKKTLSIFEKKDLYITIVESSLLSLFELIYNEYGIEYPLARKLALEFHSRAEAVAVSKSILFRDRADKSQTASAFLKLHYGSRLGELAQEAGNGLYQNELRRIDPSLMKGLDNEFGGRRDELAMILPKKKDEVNARLGPGAEHMTAEQRKSALDKMLHLGKK